MAYKRVKYILSNPSELLSDDKSAPREYNITNRVNFGESAYEYNLYHLIVQGVKEDMTPTTRELDITYVFNNCEWYFGRWAITPPKTRKQLQNVFYRSNRPTRK